MSTRCQIHIEGCSSMVYVHSDGYPKGILPTLLPFVANFRKHMGSDPLGMMARLTQAMANMYDDRMREIWKSQDFPRMSLPTTAMLAHRAQVMLEGIGVDNEIHGDIAYFYAVWEDGSIAVQRPNHTDRTFPTLAVLEPGLSLEKALKLFK